MAALKALEIWVRDGTPASEADRLATLDDDSDYQYDDHGNVLGGLRTPYVDASRGEAVRGTERWRSRLPALGNHHVV